MFSSASLVPPVTYSSAPEEDSRDWDELAASLEGNHAPLSGAINCQSRSRSLLPYYMNAHSMCSSDVASDTTVSTRLRDGFTSHVPNWSEAADPVYPTSRFHGYVMAQSNFSDDLQISSDVRRSFSNSPYDRQDMPQLQVLAIEQTPTHVIPRAHTDVGDEYPSPSYALESNVQTQPPQPVLSPTLSATSNEYSPASCGSISLPLLPTALQAATEYRSTYVDCMQKAPVSHSPAPSLPYQVSSLGSNVSPAEQESTLLSENSRPHPPSRSCAWDACCTFITADPKNLRAHLKRVHGFSLSGRESVPCKWNGCNRILQRENVVRHIVSYHMRLKVRCKSCGKDLCRRDVQTMHSKKFCPGKIDE